MLKPMAIALAAIMFAIPAQAQQPQYPDPGRSDKADTHLQDTQTPAARQDREEDDNDPTRGWNRMKRGFYTGLIVGGFVGVLMAADCGHPECGPLITLAAGAGGRDRADHRPAAGPGAAKWTTDGVARTMPGRCRSRPDAASRSDSAPAGER